MVEEENIYKPQTALGRWFDERLPLIRWLHKHVFSFKVPRNLNYFYSFGGILTLMLLSQILTGLIMAMHYVPDTSLAFVTRERFAREGQFGWLFSSWHRVGASFFFIAAYIHMARGLYYGSYKKKRELIWLIGVLIYFTMLATAFLGYVLAWGLMSTTAATVISSFIREIPFLGGILYKIFLGDYSIGQAALNRFYVFHYILPFFLIFLVFLHIWAVHKIGQTNPSGVDPQDKKEFITFSPYMIIKDIFACSVFLIFFAWFLFFMPDYMGQVDNYTMGDPLKTPDHIAPEWYFLPFYSILRSITFSFGPFSSSLLGMLVSIIAIFALVFVPWLDRSVSPSVRFRPIYKYFYWGFLCDFVFLGYLGTKPVDDTMLFYTQCAVFYYLCFFFIIMPFLPYLEKIKPLPSSLWQDYQEHRTQKKKKIW